jgi:hypothetical protein
MFQGTSEDAAFKIITNGFGIASSLDDGFYGKGIYFTSKLDYAAKYCYSIPNKGKIFLLNLVISANTFPVTEGPFQLDERGQVIYFKNEKGEIKMNDKGNPIPIPNPKGLFGQACKTGYQSHFTMVSSRKLGINFPIKEVNGYEGIADELVIFDGSQILPLFLIYTTQFDSVPTDSQNTKVEGCFFFSFFFFLFSFLFLFLSFSLFSFMKVNKNKN